MMIRKILNIVLVLLVFSASTGFTVSKHYCREQLKEVSFLISTNGCNDVAKNCCGNSGEKNHCQKNELGENCCKNESAFFKLDEQYTVKKSEEESLPDFELPLASIETFTLLFLPEIKYGSPFSNYKPPLLTRNIPVLAQSFLC